MQLGIRTRAVLWLASLAALMSAVLYLAGSLVLDRNFREFEQTQIAKDSDRVRLAMAAEAERLGAFARDYGNWDRAMEFVTGTNPDFIEENFYPESLSNIGARFVFIVDPNRHVLWSGAISTQSSDDLAPMSATLLEALLPVKAFDQVRSDLDSHSEFVWIEGECYLLGVSAVTNSNVDAFGGWLVFVRQLDVANQQALIEQTRSTFRIAPMEGRTQASDAEDDALLIEFHAAGFNATQSLHGSQRGTGIAILTSGPRPLAAQQAQAQQLLLSALVLTVLASMLLTYAILHVLVIRRVNSLSEWARGLLQTTSDLGVETTRPVDRHDEIDQLREDFSALTHELQRLSERWKAQAWQDWLTKVGNRAKLMHDLGAAQLPASGGGQSAALQALILVDLDNFKAVNDLMGHLYGDELLRDVALRILSLAPAQANVYRLGGDEFAVFWEHGATRSLVNALAQDLLVCLRMTQASISVSASIGIVIRDGGEQSSLDVLMCADIALYAAKQAGRNQFRHYQSSDFDRFKDRFDLDTLLRDALRNGEIELHYQPIVSSLSGYVHAVEALARWTTSERGAVPPATFVAVAERSGLIHELDAYVLRTSCVALAQLRRKFPSLVMNVNVSPISLQGDGFLRQLREVLATGCVDASSLRLELTETAVSIGSPALDEAASRLRALGVALIIDDFGDGASSLGRLNRLRPAGLKLDGSFVRDFEGSGGRICRAVVELARELDMSVTAECVESDAQREFLRGIGCEFLQGYYFSRSLEELALCDWLEAHERAREGSTEA